MATAHDVAAYVLQRQGEMTAMKLQKLVYYAQAWSLVWDGRPLFPERIEAWAMGPVVPELYDTHRGAYMVQKWPKGNPDALTTQERETVEAVVDFYGNRSPHWLSDLTHQEAPWRDARKGIAPGMPSNAEITHAALAEYYGSL